MNSEGRNTLITIITPTYNRSHTLGKLYESLRRQTNKNFHWLIVDDGSTDDTKEMVEKYNNDDFTIEYVYKKNGGKHTALNLAFSLVRDELLFVVDSDDYIVDSAVETICLKWNDYKEEGLCGLSFLRAHDNFEVIGDRFIRDEYMDDFIDVRINKGIRGDKAEIWVTNCLQGYSFPEYQEEKFMGEGYLYVQLARKYRMLFVNEVIYITEYMEGGLTKSGRKLRVDNPKGGMDFTKVMLEKDIRLDVRVKNAWLFICYGFFDGNGIREILKKGDNKRILKLNMACGFLLYQYWKFKYGKQ